MLEVMYRDETRPVRNALSEPVVRPSIACGSREQRATASEQHYLRLRVQTMKYASRLAGRIVTLAL